MSQLNGFWSYVCADDEVEHGRVSRLAQDVAAHHEMLIGEKIGLFLDKGEIEWGENWRGKIDKSLSSIEYIIPVLTPRYFISAECRRDLQFFARRANKLGIEELVLSLLYMDIPLLNENPLSDDLEL